MHLQSLSHTNRRTSIESKNGMPQVDTSVPPFLFLPLHHQAAAVNEKLSPTNKWASSQLSSDPGLSKLVSPWMLSSIPWSSTRNICSSFPRVTQDWKFGSKENFTKMFLPFTAAKSVPSTVERRESLNCPYYVPELSNIHPAGLLHSKETFVPQVLSHLPSYYLPSSTYSSVSSQSNFDKLKLMGNAFTKWWTKSNHDVLHKTNPISCQQCDLTVNPFQTSCTKSLQQNSIGISKPQENLFDSVHHYNYIPLQSNMFSPCKRTYQELIYPTSPVNRCMGLTVGSLASSSRDSSETSSPFESSECANENVEQTKTLLFLKQTFFDSEKKQNSHRCNVSMTKSRKLAKSTAAHSRQLQRTF